MRRIYTFTYAVATLLCITGFTACSNGATEELTKRFQELQKAELRYNNLADSLQQEAQDAAADTLFRDIKAGAPNHDTQGLNCLSDWSIRLPQCDDETEGFANKAQDMYNVFAAQNAIWSDFEIWVRGQESDFGALVPNGSIIKGIKNINPACIKDKGMREAVISYRDGMVWSITHSEECTDTKCARAFNSALFDYMLQNYLYNKNSVACLDTIEYGKLFELDVDSTETANNIVRWKGRDLWWNDLIEDKDFNNRCIIILQAEHENLGMNRWPIEAMMAIMQSGEYSPLLPRLWRTWRCCSQALFCGVSRDSVIPNYTFNRYRKMVFTTIINYLLEHPDDKQAIACAQYVMTYDDLIRNGDCIMGNDCMLEQADLGLMSD